MSKWTDPPAPRVGRADRAAAARVARADRALGRRARLTAGDKTRYELRLPTALLTAARTHAAANGTTVADLIRDALLDRLADG